MLHRGALPKLSFLKFSGENLKIWINKCGDYFCIFNVPECMWTTATSLHMEENMAKWLQVYKMKRGLGDWATFVEAVENKFGAYDYRTTVQDLLGMKHVGMVEDYTKDLRLSSSKCPCSTQGLMICSSLLSLSVDLRRR
jgi:hypothetical protein